MIRFKHLAGRIMRDVHSTQELEEFVAINAAIHEALKEADDLLRRAHIALMQNDLDFDLQHDIEENYDKTKAALAAATPPAGKDDGDG